MLTAILQVFGSIEQPNVLNNFGNVNKGGIGVFIQFALNLLIAVGAIYALFNFALAGYGFLSAGNDPKKLSTATAKIWQTVLGLALVAGSITFAAIIGKLLFGSYTAITRVTINVPK